MKREQGVASEPSRFDRAARWVEDRYGHWPTWSKIVIGIPILVVLTGLVMICVSVIGTGIVALVASGRH
jgi:hypothetical protein